MRSALVWALVFAAVATAQEMTVTTKDGKAVVGKPSLSKLKIDTAFGSATVDMDQVASVEFGDPDVVVTKDGHELRGKVKLSSLRVGKTSIKRKDLAAMAAAGAGPDFGGVWRTTFGPMKLEQRGLTIKGTYGVGDPHTIEGKLDGKRFVFTYREGNARGEGWFELWPDGQHFQGEYAIGRNKGKWGGFRATPRRAKLVPGVVTTGIAKSMVKYHVRVPKDFDPKKTYPAVLVMHGSNMNSKAYVEGNAANWGGALGEDFIHIGVDGERMSPAATPEFERYNYYYINYSGPDWGSPAIRRQSPALVAEAIEEIKEFVPISKLFVGGHSQGGYMAWFFVMYFPELVDGVFPVSGEVVVQCEPHVFDDKPKLQEKQRAVPVAIVHGERDNAVGFGSATYARFLMAEGGFPMARLFAKDTGHMYAALPVADAVRWLQRMASDDPAELVALAKESLKDGHYRDVSGALRRARTLKGAAAYQTEMATLEAQLERKAAPVAAKLLDRIRRARDGKWVPDFYAFRRDFAFTKAAQPVLKAYAKLREKHAKPAADLFFAARKLRDADARREKWQQIAKDYYASKWYFLVSRWLAE